MNDNRIADQGIKMIRPTALDNRIADLRYDLAMLDPDNDDDACSYSDIEREIATLTGEGYSFVPPTLQACVEAIGEPPEDWLARCHDIADAIGQALELPGKLQYGHYHGPIHEDSQFSGRPFSRHGWWLLEDGRVFDPTRWAFDTVDQPYIFCGEDFRDEYSFGGNRVRREMRQPPPKGDSCEQTVTLNVGRRAVEEMYVILSEDCKFSGGKITVNVHQAMWFANAPLGDLVDPLGWDFTEIVYKALVDAGNEGMIPIDNRMAVIGEYGDEND